MRLVMLTLFALFAFAANSVLTRSALAFDQIGPGEFMAIRLISGAVTLAVLVALRGVRDGMLRHGSVISAASLLLYTTAFSLAYVTLDAGLGALILFGGVQITMFAGAVIGREKPSAARWLGSLLGMIGLGVLFAPGATVPDVGGALLMGGSAVGWGIYSLRGRGVSAPLQATASNFLIAAPAGALFWFMFPSEIVTNLNGILLAIASGALASGVGYAIWYATLPKLDSSLAAIVQLTVPLIALAGGIVFLGETASWAFMASTVLILSGVFIAVFGPKKADQITIA
ncbi:MAG TPA: EamA family transporter [Rhodobacteraceae bacterium]|jgi:drug/metabolite transporter (DMT)-like permease|nr:EamA family transporter [Paracoccaceae bacterium]